MKLEITKPEIHTKQWGSEEWLINNDKFCGKILKFNKGAKFSAHFHDIKEEIQYCYKGKLILRYINTENAQQLEKEINVGDIINIPRLTIHQLESLEDSEIFEVSTTHFESDSYRVLPGDSQIPRIINDNIYVPDDIELMYSDKEVKDKLLNLNKIKETPIHDEKCNVYKINSKEKCNCFIKK